MGWNLGGIVAGAIAGGAGAAERYLVEERRNETAIAKEKELAQYKADIDFERAQRLDELKASRQSKFETQERDSVATNMGLATDAAKEAGYKPGTVEFHTTAAEFLNASGRPELAKEQLAEANRIRTDDTKDQIASKNLELQTARLEAARARREGGGSDNSIRREELEDRRDKEHTISLKDFGTYKYKDKTSGEEVVDPTGYAAVRKIDSVLKTQPEFKDRGARIDAITEIRTTADMMRRNNPKLGFQQSIELSYNKWADAYKPRAK